MEARGVKRDKRRPNEIALCLSVLYLAAVIGGIVIALADQSLRPFLYYVITVNVVGLFLVLGIHAAL